MVNCFSVLLDWCAPFCAADDARAAKMHGNFSRLSSSWCDPLRNSAQRVHYEIEASLSDPEQGKSDRRGGTDAAAAGHNASFNSSFGRDAEDEQAEIEAAIEESIRQQVSK